MPAADEGNGHADHRDVTGVGQIGEPSDLEAAGIVSNDVGGVVGERVQDDVAAGSRCGEVLGGQTDELRIGGGRQPVHGGEQRANRVVREAGPQTLVGDHAWSRAVRVGRGGEGPDQLPVAIGGDDRGQLVTGGLIALP
ncbi:hypothetical protein [Modestobacter sp. SYSU DS0511]